MVEKRKVPLYKAIVAAIKARISCEKEANTLWFEKWTKRLEEYERNFLPSGSGIDTGTDIDMDRSNKDRLILLSSYHAMDESGAYADWYDFEVIVKPDLQDDFVLRITGKFRRYAYLKDMLHETYDNALREEVEI